MEMATYFFILYYLIIIIIIFIQRRTKAVIKFEHTCMATFCNGMMIQRSWQQLHLLHGFMMTGKRNRIITALMKGSVSV